MKTKFSSQDVNNLLNNKDIVILSETHFNIRTKCPNGFFIVGRSKPSDSIQSRGGVAVYKNIQSRLKINIITENLIDCVILELCYTPIIIVAVYIAPNNSPYFTDDYFNNLELVLNHFKNRQIIIIGDMNSRIATPDGPFKYKPNPDTVINSNGRNLLNILNNHAELFVINGIIHNNLTYDSDFTYFRGKLCSQNDLCLTTSITSLQQFRILLKMLQSDHCPCLLTINTKFQPPLRLLDECARGFFSYDHYDINKRLRRPIKIENINNTNLQNDLERLATEINSEMNNPPDTPNINELCYKITDGIYNACKRNSKTTHIDTDTIPNYANCTSRNFKAIAEANFSCYQHHIKQNHNPADINYYRDQWILYTTLTNKKKNEEHDTQTNIKWANSSTDAKKLWRMIDWKGEIREDTNNELSPYEIYSFFTKIFQARKTANSPVLSSVTNLLKDYSQTTQITDKDITTHEITTACLNTRKGTGFDGLAPDIVKIIPQSIKNLLVILFQNVFKKDYPVEWENQLLFPIKKKGHSANNPSLRGIAIGPLLSRVYDDIINDRFNKWFKPNLEQAAYRKGQGCVFQILSLLLIIEHGKNIKKNIFIGLLDYEKAFDYTNRATLIEDLITQGIGHKMAEAIKSMYSKTSYTPKISNNLIGKPISTNHGVTQGRKSSGSLFAFTISDMSDALKGKSTQDFMDPYCLAQLADDTSVTSETFDSLKEKLSLLFNYSKQKYLHVNTDKTKYMHMSENPTTTPMILENNIKINPVDKKDGYSFIGFKLTYSNNIYKLIENNLNSKMFNIAKFYAWLEYNKTTPFFIKIKVLYTCLFESLLYSCEAWGDISFVAEKLLKTERAAIKRCLGVKKGTTSDLIYIETNRSDVVATIKDRQHKFFIKIEKLQPGEALVREIWNLCEVPTGSNNTQYTNLKNYYKNLSVNNKSVNMERRRQQILNSTNTMCIQYYQLTNLEHSCILYNSTMNDTHRVIITRWRLSSHKLKIETGRYTKPRTSRENRLCTVCQEIEDEHHAIFICKAHFWIREENKELLRIYKTVKEFLNPPNTNVAKQISLYLIDIEKNMKEFNML